MNPSNHTESDRFEEIRQNFDPAFSYVIFEKAKGEEDRSNFEEIFSFLSRFIKGRIKHDILYDEDQKILTLVVELTKKQKDSIMQKLLTMSLSNDIPFYIYDPPKRRTFWR